LQESRGTQCTHRAAVSAGRQSALALGLACFSRNAEFGFFVGPMLCLQAVAKTHPGAAAQCIIALPHHALHCRCQVGTALHDALISQTCWLTRCNLTLCVCVCRADWMFVGEGATYAHPARNPTYACMNHTCQGTTALLNLNTPCKVAGCRTSGCVVCLCHCRNTLQHQLISDGHNTTALHKAVKPAALRSGYCTPCAPSMHALQACIETDPGHRATPRPDCPSSLP
jgi:hypothetical protein